MRGDDKRLERKEMHVQKGKTVYKFPLKKHIAVAKKWRKGTESEISVPAGEPCLPKGETARTSSL
jgi:hypothetical protein